jgi:hypothetical protein
MIERIMRTAEQLKAKEAFMEAEIRKWAGDYDGSRKDAFMGFLGGISWALGAEREIPDVSEIPEPELEPGVEVVKKMTDLIGVAKELVDNVWNVQKVIRGEFDGWTHGKLTTLEFHQKMDGDLWELSSRLGKATWGIREAGYDLENFLTVHSELCVAPPEAVVETKEDASAMAHGADQEKEKA